MNGTTHTIRINKFLPVAVLYFFFNSFLLPLGLLYTTLLTPVFLLWLYSYPSFKYLWYFFLASLPFVLVHLIQGVNLVIYIKSYLLLFSVYVFCLAFYQFLRLVKDLGALYKELTLINTLLVVLAIFLFFIEPLKSILWYKNALTTGVSEVYRLKLFTYEASYYSVLFLPIALYYYLKVLILNFPNKLVILLFISIPLLLSLSFGVIMGLGITLILIFFSDIRLLTRNPRLPFYLAVIMLFVVVSLFLALRFFPDNLIFIRLENIFRGKDTSFSGRTFDSIYLGWKLAAQKSLLFGCGAGQIKVIGLDLFNSFYLNSFTPNQLAIPNNIGDLLAQFGLLAVLAKLGIEFYFFFKTRVYTNYYRLGLFLFIFIYQFTGSYITNIAEYVIWLLAFYPPLFPEFDKKKIFVPVTDLTSNKKA
jgi:hypothetical protein